MGMCNRGPLTFRSVVLALCLLAVLTAWFVVRPALQTPVSLRATGSAEPHPTRSEQERPAGGFIGSAILRDYAAPGRPVEEDLTDMAHALQNFTRLVKGTDPLPLGANEEIARALLGQNKARLAFLPEDSPALNARGQLVDRWGSPLFFHASSSTHVDIRSAGPDRKMWTSDDIHRRSDGTFLKAADLNPRSLNDATTAGRRR